VKNSKKSIQEVNEAMKQENQKSQFKAPSKGMTELFYMVFEGRIMAHLHNMRNNPKYLECENAFKTLCNEFEATLNEGQREKFMEIEECFTQKIDMYIRSLYAGGYDDSGRLSACFVGETPYRLEFINLQYRCDGIESFPCWQG
jgi:hypothetical protein